MHKATAYHACIRPIIELTPVNLECSPQPALPPNPVPKSREELKAAVDLCIKASPVGDCAQGPHGPIGEWDVSHVTDMSKLFEGAASFNSDISKWDVSAATDTSNMFSGATSFNSDISNWDVSRVIFMGRMFSGATSFNINISKWDVANVVNMESLFHDATSFNIDISKWDVASVTNMQSQFLGATSFAQTICDTHWLDSKAKKDNMFQETSGGFCFGRQMP